ncbi:hypothetical protein C5167_000415 [Papaver somniferum]|uniref:Uncharacterized protein n=1 Tax=Papaver somniferum TaxID=3469 RepID=A0A4Y7KSG2_PAPSO|nr:hypothetical protein C5167_000415 [Papaver somniferum]
MLDAALEVGNFFDKCFCLVLDNPLSPGLDGGGEISCILASLKGMPMKVSVSLETWSSIKLQGSRDMGTMRLRKMNGGRTTKDSKATPVLGCESDLQPITVMERAISGAECSESL